MKINEMEQLVGIQKKNIRFYEEQGLLHPRRNLANGYREYSDADAELLMKIKLLRRLEVPIEEIHRILDGELSLADCIENHRVLLNHRQHSLELVKQICEELPDSIQALEPQQHLTRMETLEQEGNPFMNVSKADVKKKKRSAILSASVMIATMLFWDGLILCANHYDPIPWGFVAILILMPGAVVVGVLLALKERMKEIDGGEENEALQY